jgi:hypothetical protein
MANEYEQVYVANGQLEADMIRLMLEAHGLTPVLRGESAGAVYGLTIGTLGEVKIFVPVAQKDQASRLLKEMENGELEADLPADSDDGETPQS